MLIAAAVPVSVTVPVPLPLPPGTLRVPFVTVSTVVSVSPVFVSDTDTLSGIAVFSLPLAAATVSVMTAVPATVIAAVWAPELWPPPSVVVTDSVSVPWKLRLPV